MPDPDFPFPLDAMPGDTALGPDGRRYRLAYDDHWYVAADQRRPGDRPIPNVAEDDPARLAAGDEAAAAFNARVKAGEAAERAALVAAAERDARAAEARASLAAQDLRGDPGDMAVGLYEGDYADVLAEVPAGVRHDGWTAERRVLFLERLEEQGSVLAAARAAGMSRRAVYRLLPRAPAFARAFVQALSANTSLLADTLFDRAIHGHEVPVFQQGELVGTRTVHHDALGLYLLRVRDPLNFAPINELERWKRERALDAKAACRSPGDGGGEVQPVRGTGEHRTDRPEQRSGGAPAALPLPEWPLPLAPSSPVP